VLRDGTTVSNVHLVIDKVTQSRKLGLRVAQTGGKRERRGVQEKSRDIFPREGIKVYHN